MRKLKSNFTVLLAQKKQREGAKRISLKQVARDTGVKEYTVYGFANNTLKDYPGEAIEKLCDYLRCEVGDLLFLEEVA